MSKVSRMPAKMAFFAVLGLFFWVSTGRAQDNDAKSKPAATRPAKVASEPPTPSPATSPEQAPTSEPAKKIEQAPLDSFPSGVVLPMRVAVSTSIVEIESINELEGTFSATFDLRLSWKDPRLAFNAKEVGLDRQEFEGAVAQEKLSQWWSPEVIIDNLAEEVSGDEPGIFLSSDGSVTSIRRIRAKLKSPFNFDQFPFDSQSLPIALRVKGEGAQRVLLVHGNNERRLSGIMRDVRQAAWSFHSLRFTNNEQRGWNGDTYSRMEVSFTATRSAAQFAPGVFIPLFVTMFLPLIALWVTNTDIHERINWVVTGLFSLIALNFTISLQYPSLTSSSGVMQIFWIGYALLGGTLFLLMTVFHEELIEQFADHEVVMETISYLRWGVPLILFSGIGEVLLVLSNS